MLRLSDAHWERIREHFPEEDIPAGRVGRKPIPSRRVLEAVLWILNTGAQRHMLPQCPKDRTGKVFDLTLPLDQVAEAYKAMDERHAIRVLLRS
jgi:transposase